jgi:hypothetical protein
MVDAKVYMDAKVWLDAPPPPELTVMNYATWCSVTVNGGAASIAPSQTMVISADATITLTATRKNSTFEVSGNMWHHTDGDAGGGETGVVVGGTTGTSTAMVTVTAGTSKCVWVCCPFAGGTGCTALPEQCL